ncbi:MAG: hypothetical protein SFU27_06090 [Thermonemataceae bacterium]|nr:hypothetical protein [Thermonemataceae bacterium]
MQQSSWMNELEQEFYVAHKFNSYESAIKWIENNMLNHFSFLEILYPDENNYVKKELKNENLIYLLKKIKAIRVYLTFQYKEINTKHSLLLGKKNDFFFLLFYLKIGDTYTNIYLRSKVEYGIIDYLSFSIL